MPFVFWPASARVGHRSTRGLRPTGTTAQGQFPGKGGYDWTLSFLRSVQNVPRLNPASGWAVRLDEVFNCAWLLRTIQTVVRSKLETPNPVANNSLCFARGDQPSLDAKLVFGAGLNAWVAVTMISVIMGATGQLLQGLGIHGPL